jgi:thiamine phosphate synthase YjbQ (UPF0047 family)
MKGKYITTQIMIAAQSRPAALKKDIHAQLAETIAERKRMMHQLEGYKRQARINTWLTKTQAA